MVHDIHKGNWIVVFKVAEEVIGEIGADISFKVYLSLFPELHDAYPYKGLGYAAPFKHAVLVGRGVLFDICAAEVTGIDYLVPVENKLHTSAVGLAVFDIVGM